MKWISGGSEAEVACVAGWDADQSYDLPEGDEYVPLPPVQGPTAPAYRTALLEAGRLAVSSSIS